MPRRKSHTPVRAETHMNTRTIAILALILVVVLILFLVL
jgi:hypothetical protein